MGVVFWGPEFTVKVTFLHFCRKVLGDCSIPAQKYQGLVCTSPTKRFWGKDFSNPLSHFTCASFHNAALSFSSATWSSASSKTISTFCWKQSLREPASRSQVRASPPQRGVCFRILMMQAGVWHGMLQEAFSHVFFLVWEVGYIPPLGVGTVQTSFLVFLKTNIGQPVGKSDFWGYSQAVALLAEIQAFHPQCGWLLEEKMPGACSAVGNICKPLWSMYFLFFFFFNCFGK